MDNVVPLRCIHTTTCSFVQSRGGKDILRIISHFLTNNNKKTDSQTTHTIVTAHNYTDQNESETNENKTRAKKTHPYTTTTAAVYFTHMHVHMCTYKNITRLIEQWDQNLVVGIGRFRPNDQTETIQHHYCALEVYLIFHTIIIIYIRNVCVCVPVVTFFLLSSYRFSFSCFSCFVSSLFFFVCALSMMSLTCTSTNVKIQLNDVFMIPMWAHHHAHKQYIHNI